MLREERPEDDESEDIVLWVDELGKEITAHAFCWRPQGKDQHLQV